MKNILKLEAKTLRETLHIFVLKESGEIRLICLPLLTVINDGNLCNFFKNILFSAQFDPEENGDYVGKLMIQLNPKNFSIDKYISELETMMDIPHREFETYVKEETEEEKTEVTAETVVEEKAEEVTAEATAEEKLEEAADTVVLLQ